MTIQGAMSELVSLLKADDIPIYYKGVIEKVIETIDDYIDGKDDYIKRKTEPQTDSHKCGSYCANYGSYKCTKCDGEMFFEDNYSWTKDEPQTEREGEQ